MKKSWIIALAVLALAGVVAVFAQAANTPQKDADAVPTAQPQETARPQAEPADGSDAGDASVAGEENEGIAQPLTGAAADDAADTVGRDGGSEAPQEVYTLMGQITEIGGDYIVLDDAQSGETKVNLFADTVFEGVEQGALAAGQYAVVLYNGIMTRSLPPIVTATKVSVYEITGTVAEVQADGRVLIDRADVSDQVLATLPEGAKTPAVGDAITIYTSGIMTMSLPPQVNAIGLGA